MKIIGIAGKINAGKTTIANDLGRKGYIKMSFGKGVKDAVSSLFGIDHHHLYDQDGKNELDEFWGLTPRVILQKFGTEAMRKVFGDDFWVKTLKKQIDERCMAAELLQEPQKLLIVIDDVRFASEAQLIDDYGGVVWEVLRKPPLPRWWEEVMCMCGLLHESEKRIPEKYVSATIGNYGSLYELRDNVLTLVRGI